MALRFTQQEFEVMRQHGVREYPNECCGVLLGRANGLDKEVREVVSLRNLRCSPQEAERFLPLENPGRESERNRYLLDPKDQLRVEKEARARGLEVLGYYHSHPNHAARPSTYDREHAWPSYSYVIVSVEGGEAKDVTSWVLADDGSQFDLEPVVVMGQ